MSAPAFLSGFSVSSGDASLSTDVNLVTSSSVGAISRAAAGATGGGDGATGGDGGDNGAEAEAVGSKKLEISPVADGHDTWSDHGSPHGDMPNTDGSPHVSPQWRSPCQTLEVTTGDS